MSKSILHPVPPPPPPMTEKILKNNTLEVIMSFLKGLNDKKVFYTKFAKKYKNTDKLLETIENCKTLQEHKELNLNVKNMIEDYMIYIESVGNRTFIDKKPKKKKPRPKKSKTPLLKVSLKTSSPK